MTAKLRGGNSRKSPCAAPAHRRADKCIRKATARNQPRHVTVHHSTDGERETHRGRQQRRETGEPKSREVQTTTSHPTSTYQPHRRTGEETDSRRCAADGVECKIGTGSRRVRAKLVFHRAKSTRESTLHFLNQPLIGGCHGASFGWTRLQAP